MGLAAAALYIACLEKNEQKKGRWGPIGSITQKDIADTAGVTEVTVRNRYKKLEEELDLKLPDKYQRREIFIRANKSRSFFRGLF